MKKKSFPLPVDIIFKSMGAYDLKCFRWLQKNSEELPVLKGANFMLWKNISEEKLRWLAERGEAFQRNGNFISLASIQSALFLESVEELSWCQNWVSNPDSDPRLIKFVDKIIEKSNLREMIC